MAKFFVNQEAIHRVERTRLQFNVSSCV